MGVGCGSKSGCVSGVGNGCGCVVIFFIKGFVIEGLRFLKRFLKNIRKVYIDRKNKKDVA